MQEIDVTELRKTELVNIQKRVDDAFTHREADIELTPDGGMRLDDYLDNLKFASKVNEELLSGVRPEDITITYEGNSSPNVAWVDNPHDYRDLLYFAYKKAVDLTQASLTDAQIFQSIDKILKHEYAHHVPALGVEGIQSIRYQVRIADDLTNGGITLQPSIGIKGKSNLWVFIDITTAPEDLSIGDVSSTTGFTIEALKRMFDYQDDPET